MLAQIKLDKSSLIVILITVVLFVIALFTKGFTHDLFLEAGVFLVSVKLILMAYQNRVLHDEIVEKIYSIHSILQKMECKQYELEPPRNSLNSGPGRQA